MEKRPRSVTTAAPSPAQRRLAPTIVLDDLHVDYRIYTRESPAERGRRVRRPPRPRLRTVPALRGVSLIARHGDAIGVVGPNGDGTPNATYMSTWP